MRILILAQDYKPMVGGIATATHELCASLSRLDGVSVKLMAPFFPGTETETWVETGSGSRRSGFKVRRVSVLGASFWSILKWTFYLRSEISVFQPDVILNTLWMPCAVAAFMSAGKIPVFTVVHGVEILESNRTFKKRVRALLSFFKKWIFRTNAAVFAVSEFTARLVVEKTGIPSNRVKVIYNGVDSQRFHPKSADKALREKYGVQDGFVFLTLSRLEDYKGVDRFIESMQTIHFAHPEAVYLVAGSGPDLARLEALRVQFNLHSHVRFIGPVPEQDLIEIFNICDVFVLLSRDDRVTPNFEGLGIVLLEAGACGKPAIVGNSGGMPEVVLDRKTGWVVSPENCDEIVAAAFEAIRDREQTEVLGRAARERVQDRFTWERVAEDVVKELKIHLRG